MKDLLLKMSIKKKAP